MKYEIVWFWARFFFLELLACNVFGTNKNTPKKELWTPIQIGNWIIANRMGGWITTNIQNIICMTYLNGIYIVLSRMRASELHCQTTPQLVLQDGQEFIARLRRHSYMKAHEVTNLKMFFFLKEKNSHFITSEWRKLHSMLLSVERWLWFCAWDTFF